MKQDMLLAGVGVVGLCLLASSSKDKPRTSESPDGVQWEDWSDVEWLDVTPSVPPIPQDAKQPRGTVELGEPVMVKNGKRVPLSDTQAAIEAAKKAHEQETAQAAASQARQAKGSALSSKLRELVSPSKASASAPKGPPPLPPRPTPKKAASPASKVNLALAKRTAPDVATHIRTKGRKYSPAVVKQFQERAGNIKADGLYGPVTASALRYFGANAPAPLFKGVNAKYVPPKGA